jgi:hypothetical protein
MAEDGGGNADVANVNVESENIKVESLPKPEEEYFTWKIDNFLELCRTHSYKDKKFYGSPNFSLPDGYSW